MVVIITENIYFHYIFFPFFLLHAASRTYQGRQEDPGNLGLKHFRFQFSIELSRHCVLSGEGQRRALPRYQNKEMKILLFFSRVEIKPKSLVYSLPVPVRHNWLRLLYLFTNSANFLK